MPITTSSLGNYTEQSIVSCGRTGEALQTAHNPFFLWQPLALKSWEETNDWWAAFPQLSHSDVEMVQASQWGRFSRWPSKQEKLSPSQKPWIVGDPVGDAAPAACCRFPVGRAAVTAVAEAGSWDQLTPEPPGPRCCTGTQLVGPEANRAVKMLDFWAYP